ncbi:diadenylate cyclase CdaA [Schwartzia succinivorans]|jgi:diadenylate cyclase|uniref:Diadenylate cyclase n=1 Tax=Schwartzia succinivorans DSM 10502 TaxID=1123243 RepID=A0A1M4ZY35_9FIRM|nr:diadenylate cyclase CdaA [Schwartzia succinivorans]SHF22905.1 diadenylate cyclase [Schwartzia succinivorans DSM 10502]
MDVSDVSFSSLMLPGQLRGIFMTIGPLDVLDILLVAIIFYKMYEMLEDTRAITIVKGLIVLMVLTMAANLMELHAIYWMLQKFVTLLFVALPIVFQPELRRTLEHLGQGRFFGKSVFLNDEEARSLVKELESAVFRLSKQKIGALIVLEREMGLNDICASGIQIDGLVTADFLMNVFIPNTPLHDGAIVIRGKRLIAAGCLLPLTDNHSLSSELGTRHRAAIGLSEQCDALVVVVSEETGIVSVCEEGRIVRSLDPEQLRSYLRPIFKQESVSIKEIVANWRMKK